MTPHPDAQAYLVGGGIASLAAAVFLIRDGHFAGRNIHILEAQLVPGGALDAATEPAYVTRGGRMLEEQAYGCLWDLLDSIPAETDPPMTIKQQIWEFNAQWPTDAKARLIGADHEILDASALGLNWRDRAQLARLLALPEAALGRRRINQMFSAHFFDTNFWCLWRTTFAFQNWHSAVELRRYFLRFIQEFPQIHTLSGVRRTPLNQYDSIVLPIQRWLEGRGVRVETGIRVTDVDFHSHGERRYAEQIRYTREGEASGFPVTPRDFVFITLGSMTADSDYAGNEEVPRLITDGRDGSWELWERIATKAADFGRPTTFSGSIPASKWESFTLTVRDPILIKRLEEFSGNLPGEGALMTFKDSPWLMSIVVPRPPHFAGQPDNVWTIWGYGLLVDTPGDYVPTTMAAATGTEILTELVGQLGFGDVIDDILASTSVVTVMLPYITSQFAARGPGDRPAVIPRAAKNFAFLGQFVELPEAVVFTVEYSVRTAMQAVYGLLELDRPLPAIYRGMSDPAVALRALRTAFA